MPRAGLHSDRVVAAAADLADEVGPDQLTLAALAARLGVRQPSLYRHVASLDALRQLVAMRGQAEAGDVLGRAAIGLARDDALIAMAHAWRAWARDHPGRYQIAERAPARGDAGHQAISDRFVAVIAAVMAGYGLHGDAAIDAIRVFRSALHGFVSLEANGGFGLPVSVDRSFDCLVQALVRAMSTWSTASESDKDEGLPGRQSAGRHGPNGDGRRTSGAGCPER
ncbi:MAG: TetR-like C-terminal domain-containing protein [Streptosporangiaceae bacterium]